MQFSSCFAEDQIELIKIIERDLLDGRAGLFSVGKQTEKQAQSEVMYQLVALRSSSRGTTNGMLCDYV